MSQKPPLELSSKTGVGIGRLLRYGGGRERKRERRSRMRASSPRGSSLSFSARVARPMAVAIGLPPWLCAVGGAPFCCGGLHLIRHGDAMTPSPQGEGFWLIAVKQTPPAGGSRSFFPQKKRRTPAGTMHSTPTVWQAWPAQPDTRVKRAEKEREGCGSSLLVSGPFPLFFTKACQTADHPNAGFFVSFFS